jgi:hypothetical protein
VNPIIKDHLSMETKLEKYAGLILYMRELDEDRYQKLCAVSSQALLGSVRSRVDC